MIITGRLLEDDTQLCSHDQEELSHQKSHLAGISKDIASERGHTCGWRSGLAWLQREDKNITAPWRRSCWCLQQNYAASCSHNHQQALVIEKGRRMQEAGALLWFPSEFMSPGKNHSIWDVTSCKCPYVASLKTLHLRAIHFSQDQPMKFRVLTTWKIRSTMLPRSYISSRAKGQQALGFWNSTCKYLQVGCCFLLSCSCMTIWHSFRETVMPLTFKVSTEN